jgi:pyruvoyl-dependent arginine decarboxylase
MMPIAYSSVSCERWPTYPGSKKSGLCSFDGEPYTEVSSSVAVAIPSDQSCCGLIMEYHSSGPESSSLRTVEGMVREGMKLRNREIKDVYSISSEAFFNKETPDDWVTSFSGVVMVGLDTISTY